MALKPYMRMNAPSPNDKAKGYIRIHAGSFSSFGALLTSFKFCTKVEGSLLSDVGSLLMITSEAYLALFCVIMCEKTLLGGVGGPWVHQFSCIGANVNRDAVICRTQVGLSQVRRMVG